MIKIQKLNRISANLQKTAIPYKRYKIRFAHSRLRTSSVMQRIAVINNTPVDTIIVPWPPRCSLKVIKQSFTTL